MKKVSVLCRLVFHAEELGIIGDYDVWIDISNCYLESELDGTKIC